MATPVAKNFLVDFSIASDGDGNTTVTVNSTPSIPSKLGTVSSLVNKLKSSLSTSTPEDLTSQLAVLQTKLQNSLSNYNTNFSSYLNDIYGKIFDKLSGIFSKSGSSVFGSANSSSQNNFTLETQASNFSTSELTELQSIITSIQYLLTNFSEAENIHETTGFIQSSATKSETHSSTFGSSSVPKTNSKLDSMLNSSKLTERQHKIATKLLDIVNEINSISTTNTRTMKPRDTQASKSSGQIKSNGSILRTKNRSLSDMSSSISVLSQNILSLSGNDRTLANGISKMAQIVTSYSKNIGNNGKPPDITKEPVPSTTMTLYPTASTTTNPMVPAIQSSGVGDETLSNINTSIANLQNTILNNGSMNSSKSLRSKIRSRRNKKPTMSTADEQTIETGINALITSLRNDLKTKSDTYTRKVNDGTATLSDTTDYISQVSDINGKISSLENNITKLQNSVTTKPKGKIQTRMINLGTSIGNSSLGTYIKTFLGGKPYTAAPSSKQKTTLQSQLSKMSVSQPTPLVFPLGSYEGVLSSLDISTSSIDDDIIVNCSSVIEDQPFSITYNLSASQLSSFTENILPNLDTSSLSAYTSYLVFLYTFLSIYSYIGLYSDNKLNVTNSQYDASNVILGLDPDVLTEYSTNIIPQCSLSLSPDSQSILNVTSGTNWIPDLYGSTNTNSKYQTKSISNTVLVGSIKHILGNKSHQS